MDRSLIKQQVKQSVRRVVGEPYVGKRLKLRNLNRVVPSLGLHPEVILDAGAEDATFVYWLADRFPEAHVVAVDIDVDAMDACRAARPSKYAQRVSFEVGTFDTLDQDRFDLVTAFDVLEHIPDDRAAVAHLYRAMAPGSTILVHVPRDVWTHLDGRKEHVRDDDAWKINAGHVRQGYSPSGLAELLESAGFEVVDVQAWLRRYGVIAHEVYARVERVVPLRLLTIPLTDAAARLDRQRPPSEGNTVWVQARKRG